MEKEHEKCKESKSHIADMLLTEACRKVERSEIRRKSHESSTAARRSRADRYAIGGLK